MTTTHHRGPLAVGNNNNNPNTLIWTTAGATPPSTAVELQDAHQETRPIEVGQLCITNTGSIYRCTNASNQAALVWQLISGAGGTIAVDPAVAGNLAVQAADGSLVDAGYAADTGVTGGSVVRRDSAGRIAIRNTQLGGQPSFRIDSDGGAIGIEAVSQTGTGMVSASVSGLYHHRFSVVSAIDRVTGTLTFISASADANRNAQLTELFASIPTADPLVAGRLWSNGGIVTISAG